MCEYVSIHEVNHGEIRLFENKYIRNTLSNTINNALYMDMNDINRCEQMSVSAL